MAQPPRPLIEQCAVDAQRAWYRHLDLDPPPWDRLRARDRARWQAVADAAVARWLIARDTPCD